MVRHLVLLAATLAVIGPTVATARTQTRVKFKARFIADTGESPELSAGREKFFKDKSAEERFASLAKSTKFGGSCYVCHQKGSTRPHNAFGWAAEQLGLQSSFQDADLTKDQVTKIFKGSDRDEKNELADHFVDAAVMALDYWVVLNDDGELELTKDAIDEEGNPLTFGRRVAQGKLPATDVKGTSFESVFPKAVLDKLHAIRKKQLKK